MLPTGIHFKTKKAMVNTVEKYYRLTVDVSDQEYTLSQHLPKTTPSPSFSLPPQSKMTSHPNDDVRVTSVNPSDVRFKDNFIHE